MQVCVCVCVCVCVWGSGGSVSVSCVRVWRSPWDRNNQVIHGASFDRFHKDFWSAESLVVGDQSCPCRLQCRCPSLCAALRVLSICAPKKACEDRALRPPPRCGSRHSQRASPGRQHGPPPRFETSERKTRIYGRIHRIVAVKLFGCRLTRGFLRQKLVEVSMSVVALGSTGSRSKFAKA